MLVNKKHRVESSAIVQGIMMDIVDQIIIENKLKRTIDDKFAALVTW